MIRPTRSTAMFSLLRVALVVGSPLVLLGACSTRFVSSAALENSAPGIVSEDTLVDQEPGVWWAHQYSLPLEIHGNFRGHSAAETASLSRRTAPTGQQASNIVPSIIDHSGRIVIYVNPVRLPADEALCEDNLRVNNISQSNGGTSVTAALCDETKTLAVVHGVVTADASANEIKSGLGTIQSALFWDLYKTPLIP